MVIRLPSSPPVTCDASPSARLAHAHQCICTWIPRSSIQASSPHSHLLALQRPRRRRRVTLPICSSSLPSLQASTASHLSPHRPTASTQQPCSSKPHLLAHPLSPKVPLQRTKIVLPCCTISVARRPPTHQPHHRRRIPSLLLPFGAFCHPGA